MCSALPFLTLFSYAIWLRTSSLVTLMWKLGLVTGVYARREGYFRKFQNKFSPVKKSAALNSQTFCFGLACLFFFFFVEMEDDDIGV